MTISVKGLVKYYGNKEVLKGVSLTAERGAVTAVLGPNGAGKTTTIRIIMTLIFPTKGEVSILGQDPFRHKKVFRKVGYVQELPNLPQFLTGRELLRMSSKIKGASKEDVDRVLKIVGMEENADKKIAKYSKGMTQRIAIAEALLGDPEVLVMDEPNIGTDPVLNHNMRETLKEMKKEGKTILMTTHVLEDVKRVADKVYLLYQGKVFFEGTPEDLVKKFLGVVVITEASNVEVAERSLKELDYVRGFKVEGNKLVIRLSEDRREELLHYLVTSGVRIRSFYLDQELEEAYITALKEAEKVDRENSNL
ncbi:MAG: ABC transporter ATP-binding protein [Candidatus Aramenus sulfurataquae]|jgi:ABC-2 type transport system ATP-binding protein|uniref:ABC transporter ATP-binding protein n=2 Tax=Candidatus Aramenus sulfurataquae TaxID=1326980 RepID=A0A0F2LSU7_9CREN|nr:ABC transporter ATP-binding protein [Candidatus Aramenus sulfurataquae]